MDQISEFVDLLIVLEVCDVDAHIIKDNLVAHDQVSHGGCGCDSLKPHHQGVVVTNS